MLAMWQMSGAPDTGFWAALGRSMTVEDLNITLW